MTTVVPMADRGVMTCDKCGNDLVVAEWKEYVSDGVILNFWRCWECGYQFETEEYMTDIAAKIDSNMVEQFFPSLLVA